jgi:hypothetical protein
MREMRAVSRRVFMADVTAGAVSMVAGSAARLVPTMPGEESVQLRLDGPNLRIGGGQQVTLGIANGRASNGALRVLRPRTTAALKTMFAVPTRDPARLDMPQMFELVDAVGRFTMLPPDQGIAGMTRRGLRVVAHALPRSGTMPVNVAVTTATVPRKRPGAVRRLVIPDPVADPGELRRLGWVLQKRLVPVPEALRNFTIVAPVLAFGDIEIEDGGALIIGPSVMMMNMQSLTMHQNARIVQNSVSLVVNCAGEIKGA